MTRTVVIKARKVGPSTVELDQPLPDEVDEIEVPVHVKTEGRLPSEVISSQPPGTRRHEDIDRQLREDRDW
jgi:hypothetical protein